MSLAETLHRAATWVFVVGIGLGVLLVLTLPGPATILGAILLFLAFVVAVAGWTAALVVAARDPGALSRNQVAVSGIAAAIGLVVTASWGWAAFLEWSWAIVPVPLLLAASIAGLVAFFPAWRSAV